MKLRASLFMFLCCAMEVLAEVHVHSFWYYFVVTDIKFPFFRVYICALESHSRRRQQMRSTNAELKRITPRRQDQLFLPYPFFAKKKKRRRRE